jgi:hypothetical protein
MNDIVTHTGLKVPAHLVGRIGPAAVSDPTSLSAAVMAGVGGESTSRISLKGARFRIIEHGEEILVPTLHLDVVVVGANPAISKTWYAQGWSPDQEAAAPDCSSDNGIVPNPDSPMKQAASCAGCPQNVWGSKQTDTGQQLKACSDHKRLAVVGPEDPSAGIYLLNVTPAALKGLGQYIRQLNQHGIPVQCVITRMTFDPSASFPKLQFQIGGYLSAEQQAAVDAVMQDPEAIRAVTRAPDPAAPAPVVPPTLAPPPAPVVPPTLAPPPAPVVPPAAPAPAPAPAPAASPAKAKRRSGFGASSAAPAPAPAPAPAAVSSNIPAPPPAPAAETAEPVVVSSNSSSLAAEIAALLNPGGAV